MLNLEEPEEIPTISSPKFIEDRLNDSQQQAVIKSLNSENISLIQELPGTGKTKSNKRNNRTSNKKNAIETADSPRILIVSQSHTAVDNILEGLDKIIADDRQIIRIGADKNVSSKIANRYTMPAHRDKIFETVPKNISIYNETRDKLLEGITNVNEIERWNKIKRNSEGLD